MICVLLPVQPLIPNACERDGGVECRGEGDMETESDNESWGG